MLEQQQNNETQKPFLKRISDMEKAITELKKEMADLKKQSLIIKKAIKRKI